MKVRTITPAQEHRFNKVYYRAHKAELMNEIEKDGKILFSEIERINNALLSHRKS